MGKKIRLMFAQGNELFRKSLVALINTRPEFQITAEARHGKELMERLKLIPADIVLMDAEMPVMDGRASLQAIIARFPRIRVIIIGPPSDGADAADFMSRGAACFLTTDCGIDRLFAAILSVKKEGHYFDSAISKAMLGALIKGRPAGVDIVFSNREIEVLKAICEGKTNKEIATGLYLSASTIDFHKARLYEKTGCYHIAGLVKYALKAGIISLA